MSPEAAPNADPQPSKPAQPAPSSKPVKPAKPAPQPEAAASQPPSENAAPDGSGEQPAPAVPEPTADEDLLRIESFDWRRAVVLRLQNGRHPDPVIEEILKRRIDLDREAFQGPLPVRVLCTLAIVFIVCIVVWVAGWGVFSLLGLDGWVLWFSGLMVTVLAASLGVAAFQPIRIYDEIGAVARGQEKFDELRRQVEEIRISKRRTRS